MTAPHERRPLRVVVLGLGRLGLELCAAAQASDDAELVAVVSARGPAALAGGGLGAVEVAPLDVLLARGDVDVLLHGGGEAPDALAALLARAARAGLDVVTSAALLHPAVELGADAAAELDALARAHGARLLSTGVNPGFLLDLLPGACAVLAPGWTRLVATRTVEAGAWGRGTLEHLGVGGEPAALEAHVPLSLTPSLHVLAELVGCEPQSVHEDRRALVAHEPVPLGDGHIAPGRARGFHQRVTATGADGRTIELAWHVVVGLASREPGAVAGVALAIDGPSPLAFELTGAFSDDPYPATAARMLHGALAMRALAPGLLTVADVPFGRRRAPAG